MENSNRNVSQSIMGLFNGTRINFLDYLRQSLIIFLKLIFIVFINIIALLKHMNLLKKTNFKIEIKHSILSEE